MSNGKDMGDCSESEVRQRFCRILKKANDLGLKASHLEKLQSLQTLETKKKGWFRWLAKVWNFALDHWVALFFTGVLFLTLVSCILITDWPVDKRAVLGAWFYLNNGDVDADPCIVEAGDHLIDVVRPPVDCEMCEDVTEVDHVSGMLPHEFEDVYAYSGRPVVITDGMEKWTAPKHFSFEFFQGIYKDDSPVLQNLERNCQFFPYKTNFGTLGEVFNMSKERAEMKEGSEPWYIGWSNCDPSAAGILRQHYNRPYFLPAVAESSRTDWIFMGSPGYGAHLHIDNVGNPSWQAQVTGTKLWTLEPPPECYLRCKKQIQTLVKPGEIIVLDTNIWFHSTLIVGDNMSITIGSEYD